MIDPSGHSYRWIHISAYSNIKGLGRIVPYFPQDDITAEMNVDTYFLFNKPLLLWAYLLANCKTLRDRLVRLRLRRRY